MRQINIQEVGKDFAKYLSYLEREGLLVRIKEEVDTERDIGDYIYKSAMEGGPALLFENIKGYNGKLPAVGALLCTRERCALAIGAAENKAVDKLIYAQENPIPPVILDKDPYEREIYQGGDVDIPRILPVAKSSPKDGGKYISAGIAFIKDPEFGRNISIHREQVLSKNRLAHCISQTSRHAHIFRLRSEEKGKPLQVSLVLGCGTDLLFASQVSAPIGLDETSIAGGLRGEPVRLVKGKTIDNEFPADAHVVIEGEIAIGIRMPEGPFGEFTGHYSEKVDQQLVIDVKAIIIRKDVEPIFYGCVAMPKELGMIKQIVREASAMISLRKVLPGVRNVHCPWYRSARALLIVQLKKTRQDDGKIAIHNILSTNEAPPNVVIVVDEDVDISNPEEVINAVASGGTCDPSYCERAPEEPTTIGIDATKPLGFKYPERIENHKTSREIPKSSKRGLK